MELVNHILMVSRMVKFDEKGIRYGASLARKYGATLTVVHVFHDPFGVEGWNLPMPNLDKDYLNLLLRTREALDRLVSSERAQGTDIDVVIREGEPLKEILAIVKERAIDLIILLAHEEGNLEHFLFGRSNNELLLKMPCNILLIKKEPGFVYGSWDDEKS